LEAKDRVAQLVCQTFEILRAKADFESPLENKKENETSEEATPQVKIDDPIVGRSEDVDLRLSYTINLVLPKTDDPAVFNAIFKSLKENLLRK